jgi:hypothetical protein
LEQPKPEKRRVWLTTRQIGVVAAVGGLGFAYAALGLYIPIVPPFIVDIREPLAVIIAMSAGPYAAIIAGVLMGLGLSPVDGIPYYVMLGFLFSLVSKKVWKLTGWKRYALLVGSILAIYVFVLGPWLSFAESVIYGMTFWDWWNIMWGVAIFPMYIIEEIVVILVAMKFAPEFMKPRWLWSGGEELD